MPGGWLNNPATRRSGSSAYNQSAAFKCVKSRILKISSRMWQDMDTFFCLNFIFTGKSAMNWGHCTIKNLQQIFTDTVWLTKLNANGLISRLIPELKRISTHDSAEPLNTVLLLQFLFSLSNSSEHRKLSCYRCRDIINQKLVCFTQECCYCGSNQSWGKTFTKVFTASWTGKLPELLIKSFKGKCPCIFEYTWK